MDPTIAGSIISGIVSLVSAYMTYRVGMKDTDQKGALPPDKPDGATLKNGEAAMNVVRTGIVQFGNADEQADLVNFERNPTRYEPLLATVVTDIARRNATFAQQLQLLAQHTNLSTSPVHGTVNVSGGTVYGPVAGTNTATMDSTYTFTTPAEDYHDSEDHAP